jgi:hypothetical protein
MLAKCRRGAQGMGGAEREGGGRGKGPSTTMQASGAWHSHNSTAEQARGPALLSRSKGALEREL